MSVVLVASLMAEDISEGVVKVVVVYAVEQISAQRGKNESALH